MLKSSLFALFGAILRTAFRNGRTVSPDDSQKLQALPTLRNSIDMEFVLIEAGEFVMGSDAGASRGKRSQGIEGDGDFSRANRDWVDVH